MGLSGSLKQDSIFGRRAPGVELYLLCTRGRMKDRDDVLMISEDTLKSEGAPSRSWPARLRAAVPAQGRRPVVYGALVGLSWLYYYRPEDCSDCRHAERRQVQDTAGDPIPLVVAPSDDNVHPFFNLEGRRVLQGFR